MKQRSIISLAMLLGYLLFSTVSFAGNTNEQNSSKTHSNLEKQMDQKAPASQDGHSKAPVGKAHAPHSEELPHIHKFHKDRVKKIRKHHGKYWLLSKVLLALCHLSILVISYLHAAH